MKKLAFLFVAVSAISFVSCGNNTECSESCCDSDTVVVDTVDTVAVDTVAADTVA